VAITIRGDRVSQWPSPVPREVELDCLNEYMDGSKWCESPICAICSCYARDVVSVPISTNLTPYNLELLRVSDEFIIRKCVLQGMSLCFMFGNAKIDGLMLAKDGLIFNTSVAEELQVCPSCMSSLTKHKIPRFALANNLFRGMLPVQFNDLTWVEEKSLCDLFSHSTCHPPLPVIGPEGKSSSRGQAVKAADIDGHLPGSALHSPPQRSDWIRVYDVEQLSYEAGKVVLLLCI